MTPAFYRIAVDPTNQPASDDQDLARFQTLHRLDIILRYYRHDDRFTLIIALGYVLPHFTFWQH